MLPKIITPINTATITIITLTIKGRPLSVVFNLTRLLDSIENNVFKGITWQVTEQSREALVQRYQQLHIYNQPLFVTYQLLNIQPEILAYLEQAISREAEIRLFN